MLGGTGLSDLGHKMAVIRNETEGCNIPHFRLHESSWMRTEAFDDIDLLELVNILNSRLAQTTETFTRKRVRSYPVYSSATININ